MNSDAKKDNNKTVLDATSGLLVLPVVLFKPELFKLSERFHIRLYSTSIMSPKNIFKCERTDFLEEKMPFYF